MMQPPTGAQRPKPDMSQGAQPRDPEDGQLTKADLAGMTPHEIRDAQERGQFRDLLSGRYA